MTKTINADLCILGAGSGGLSVAAGASQLGRKVVLIESGKMGGDCLNYGCVPSKAFITAAAMAEAIRQAPEYGVHASKPEVDFSAVIDHVHKAIAAIEPNDSQERFEGLGVTVIRAQGAFCGPRQVLAGEHIVNAKHFVIATGSAPAIPPIKGLDETPYFTNETIFDNRTLPDHLLIIGGGAIGIELAQAFRRLGSMVTIIEASTILNSEDHEAVSILCAQLKAEGIDIRENATVTSVRKSDGAIEAEIAGKKISGSHLLVAAGRCANVGELSLAKANVETTAKGVVLNKKLQTSNSRIYAIGDAAGGLQFTHVAGDHASTVVRNILFKMPAKRRDGMSPRVTYTSPEIASIGVADEAAKQNFPDARTVRVEFEDNDRAQAEGRVQGFAKVTTDKSGHIIGATLVGPQAGDLIHVYALALANKLKISAFTNYIAPYPTRGETAKRAAGAWYGPKLFSDRTRMLVRLLSLFD